MEAHLVIYRATAYIARFWVSSRALEDIIWILNPTHLKLNPESQPLWNILNPRSPSSRALVVQVMNWRDNFGFINAGDHVMVKCKRLDTDREGPLPSKGQCYVGVRNSTFHLKCSLFLSTLLYENDCIFLNNGPIFKIQNLACSGLQCRSAWHHNDVACDVTFVMTSSDDVTSVQLANVCDVSNTSPWLPNQWMSMNFD